MFLNKLDNETKYKSQENIEKCDPKEIIKHFLTSEDLYSGIEMIMQATVVGCIKVSVESSAESMISKYNNHNDKKRNLGEQVADDEMMIDYNGPVMAEADGVLKDALDLHFKSSEWYFTGPSIFRLRGKTVDKILSRKSRLPLFK